MRPLPHALLAALLLGPLSCKEPVERVRTAEPSTATRSNVPTLDGSARSVQALRIMIVGDSISAGPGCYKKYLLRELLEQGHSDFQFVGEYADDCDGNVRHSAVSCSRAEDYTRERFKVPHCFEDEEFPGFSRLVKRHAPDLVLIQLGVNDVWGGKTRIDGVLANYTTLVKQGRALNPRLQFVIAQIHRIITDNCTNTASTENAEALIKAVPAWSKTLSTGLSPIRVADLWTNSDPRQSEDCVHPDEAGARRMAENWYAALREVIPLRTPSPTQRPGTGGAAEPNSPP